jgi:hypothetical protein
MTFKYDKENLFKEFAIAKTKDIALSKKKTLDEKENDYFTNRIIFCDEHFKLQQKHPEYYDLIDVKFDKLKSAYQTVNPRDTFYKIVFNKTFNEVRAADEPISINS